MENFEVWIKAREPKALAVVAAVRVYHNPERLLAERAVEQAQSIYQPTVQALLAVHPGAIVSTEMVMPGAAADDLIAAQNKVALLSAALAQAEQREQKLLDVLRRIADLDDERANEMLALTGSWTAFDEPASVQTARAALCNAGIVL